MPKTKKAKKLDSSRCPCCGSTDMGGDMFDTSQDQVTQECHCTSCDARWIDIYTLTKQLVRKPDEDDSDLEDFQ